MRKIFTTVLILSMIAGAQAQNPLGLKFGTDYYRLHSSNNKLQDYSTGKFGYLLGLTYEMILNKSVSIQPEVVYSYQVARETYYGSNLHLSYVQVPVLFQYQPTNSVVKLYAGPQVAFLSNAKLKPDNGKVQSVSNQFVQTDFGYAFGVGTAPCKGGFSIDLRVYRGITNVVRATYDNGTKTRPTMVSFSIGYRFGAK